jgi:UDP-glucose 4-epimerase
MTSSSLSLSSSSPRVALVGGSGLVGGALTSSLAARGCAVVVVDRVAPRACPRGVVHMPVDLLHDDAEGALVHAFATHGADVVVHLAARVDPPRDDVDRARMRRLHEHGTRACARAARRAGARRFVLVSSAVVYGAWPENPVPLDEDAPLRPRDFPYAIDKALQERVAADAWGTDALVVVRPAIVYAPHARSYLTEILRRARLPLALPGLPRGVLPALDGHRPPLQFVHVDDVAAVLVAAVLHDDDALAGAFHACSRDWLAFDEVAREAGLAVVDVDARLVGRVLDRLVPLLPPSLRAPSALFPYLQHPFVLSSTKTAARLGVTPRMSSREALASMLARRTL